MLFPLQSSQYTHTVFEITHKSLGSQDALGAGGRYNSLVSQLGGSQVDAIGFALGAKIKRATRIMHGKTSLIYHNKKNIFKGLSNPFVATRYHSLIVDPKSVPSVLEVTAKTKDKEIMAIRVKNTKCFGIQFHPESILTKEGKALLKNFLRL